MNEKPAPDDQEEKDVQSHQEDQSLSEKDEPVQEEKEIHRGSYVWRHVRFEILSNGTAVNTRYRAYSSYQEYVHC